MLLGQAESGKSTLQKQFQLYYASQTLDRERPFWRPIVYTNILRAIRAIFDALESRSAPSPGSPEPEPIGAGPSTLSISSSSGSASPPPPESMWSPELSHLRSKLLPLMATEDALAAELSGGIQVGGGRTGVYLRAGWQALITPNRSWPVSDIRHVMGRPTEVADIVARTLTATKEAVTELWQHPSVRKLVKTNKLRLEESAALLVDSSRLPIPTLTAALAS